MRVSRPRKLVAVFGCKRACFFAASDMQSATPFHPWRVCEEGEGVIRGHCSGAADVVARRALCRERYRVIVVLPVHPEGDPDSDSSIQVRHRVQRVVGAPLVGTLPPPAPPPPPRHCARSATSCERVSIAGLRGFPVPACFASLACPAMQQCRALVHVSPVSHVAWPGRPSSTTSLPRCAAAARPSCSSSPLLSRAWTSTSTCRSTTCAPPAPQRASP